MRRECFKEPSCRTNELLACLKGYLKSKRPLIIRLFRLLLLVFNLEPYLVVSDSLQYPLFDDVAFDKRRRQSGEFQCAHGFQKPSRTLFEPPFQLPRKPPYLFWKEPMFQTLTPHVRPPKGRLKMKQELQTEICLAVPQDIVAF
jgi:hypothetical protein